MNQPSKFPKTKRPPTIFNQIETEITERAKHGQDIIALHIGDTYLPLPKELLDPIPDEEQLFGSRLNRYGDTYGEPPLRQLLLEKVRTRNQIPADGLDCIQIANGATGALSSGFSRLLEPDAEILTLAPYWTILRIVAAHTNVRLVEVPFFDQLTGPFDPAEQMGKYLTSRTRAIYLNTPSNPTGILLDRKCLEQIAQFAKRHDLWVFADEAYEDFIWSGEEHCSIASLPDMFERTISVYTFSKCFGASGLRVGYAVGAAPVMAELNRGVVGGYYEVGRYDQRMAWRGMQRFRVAIGSLRPKYAATWAWMQSNLQMESLPSMGGFYFFVRLGSGWKGLSSSEKVNRMLDVGVVMSPGEAFGDVYDEWARLCFTVVPPDTMKEVVEKLNGLVE